MMARKQAEELSYGIIGLGRFGSALASTLAEAGKEIMVQADPQFYRACICGKGFAEGDPQGNRDPEL